MFWLKWFKKNKPVRGTFIAPVGRADKVEPCHVCGRLPELWEDGFMVYGQAICEDCFWDEPYKEGEVK
jgi:hypothetical protein